MRDRLERQQEDHLVDAKVNENPQVMRDIKDKFLRYYSVTLGNYDVTKHFLSQNPE